MHLLFKTCLPVIWMLLMALVAFGFSHRVFAEFVSIEMFLGFATAVVLAAMLPLRRSLCLRPQRPQSTRILEAASVSEERRRDP